MLILVLLMLAQKGLVAFVPFGCVRIRGPYKMHHKGFAVLFQADGLSLTQGQTIVLDDGGRYRSAEIVEIHIDGNSVQQATGSEVGVSLASNSRCCFRLVLQHPPRES